MTAEVRTFPNDDAGHEALITVLAGQTVELIAMALVIAASVGATRAGARLSDGEASESVGVADDGEREG